MTFDSKLINSGIGIGTGLLIGHGIVTVINSIFPGVNLPQSFMARSYATYTCSDLCKMGKCDAYNCRGDCTAGCTACGGASAVGRNCPSCSDLCTAKRCSDYNCRCVKGCTACGGIDAVGNCGPGGTTLPPPGGAWYRATGSIIKMPNKRHCDSNCGKSNCNSGSSGGNRWEIVESGMASGYEVVFYFSIPSGKMCSGGHIGLKHGGPNHTPPCGYQRSGYCGDGKSGCCCWWDTGIRDTGAIYTEIEASHESSPSNCREKRTYGSIGRRLDGGIIGVRWGIYKEGSAVRLMLWTDTSGGVNNKWTQRYNILDTGQIMPSSYYSHIPSTHNVEIRLSDVNYPNVSVKYGPYCRKL